jgi:hypothetical protein
LIGVGEFTMASRVADPKKPETKPHGTTKDQIAEMESEGQAQTHPDVDDEQSATGDTTGQPDDPNVEEPGDTQAADIVGRTGEEMPEQSHDGLEARSRKNGKRETIH